MVKPKGNYVPQAYMHSKLASLLARQSQIMRQFQAEEGQLENQLKALKGRIHNTKEERARKRLLYQYTQDMNRLRAIKARKMGITAELKKEEARLRGQMK